MKREDTHKIDDKLRSACWKIFDSAQIVKQYDDPECRAFNELLSKIIEKLMAVRVRAVTMAESLKQATETKEENKGRVMEPWLTSLEICDTNDHWQIANTDDDTKPLCQIIKETVGDNVDGKITFWYRNETGEFPVAIHLKKNYLKVQWWPRTGEKTQLLIDVDEKCDTTKRLCELITEHRTLIAKNNGARISLEDVDDLMKYLYGEHREISNYLTDFHEAITGIGQLGGKMSDVRRALDRISDHIRLAVTRLSAFVDENLHSEWD